MWRHILPFSPSSLFSSLRYILFLDASSPFQFRIVFHLPSPCLSPIPTPFSPTTKCRRKIRYKSPEGRVFHSRGPLIRFSLPSNTSNQCSSLVIDTSMKTTWRRSSSWKLWKDCWKPTRVSGLKSRAEMIGKFPLFFHTLSQAGSSSIWMSTGIFYFSCASDTIIMLTCQRCDICFYICLLLWTWFSTWLTVFLHHRTAF